MYLRGDPSAQLLLSQSNSVCKSLVIKVMRLTLILVSIYRPPNGSLKQFREAINVCQDVIAKAM